MEGQGVEGVSCPHSEETYTASLSDSTRCRDTEQKSLTCAVMFIFLMQVTEGSCVATAFTQKLNIMVKIQIYSAEFLKKLQMQVSMFNFSSTLILSYFCK